MKSIAPILLALALPAMADTVTSTRVSAYDYQAQDVNGVKISDHARFDTALIACLNNPACVFVAGGKYKITRTTTTPVPPTPTPAPPPANGTAMTSWIAPTQNTDGSPLTNLAGFKVYHGTSASVLTDVRQVASGVLSYSFTGLASGAHYFAVTAITASGAESALSVVGTKVIQ